MFAQEVMQQLKAQIAVEVPIAGITQRRKPLPSNPDDYFANAPPIVRSISSQPMAKVHEHEMFHCRQSRFV